jgi:ferredoxin
MNRDFSFKWPNITRKKPPLPEAEDFKDKPDKYKLHFSDKPGSGD